MNTTVPEYKETKLGCINTDKETGPVQLTSKRKEVHSMPWATDKSTKSWLWGPKKASQGCGASEKQELVCQKDKLQTDDLKARNIRLC